MLGPSSLISLKEEIEPAPGVRRAANEGLVVVGGEGFGPIEARLAGIPSEMEARGRGTVVDDLAVPVEPVGDVILREAALVVSGEG